MFVFSRFFRRIHPLGISAFVLLQIDIKMAQSQVSQRAETPSTGPISVAIWTDHGKYSLGDAVKVNAALQNTGDTLVYVDRRMFWTGLGRLTAIRSFFRYVSFQEPAEASRI